MRRAKLLAEEFFNDGPLYVLSSTSLGGIGLSADEISLALSGDDEATYRDLLSKGACLPLHFPFDCAMDKAAVVIGDLNDVEEEEWVGRVRSRLEIPCGEFLVLANGIEEENWELPMEGLESDFELSTFETFRVEPGSYLVEVLAYVGSYTITSAWMDSGVTSRLRDWWSRSRPGEAEPAWIESALKSDGLSHGDHGLLTYLIHLTPLTEDVPVPRLGPVTSSQSCELWVGDYEMREPVRCPRGIDRAQYGEDSA